MKEKKQLTVTFSDDVQIRLIARVGSKQPRKVIRTQLRQVIPPGQRLFIDGKDSIPSKPRRRLSSGMPCSIPHQHASTADNPVVIPQRRASPDVPSIPQRRTTSDVPSIPQRRASLDFPSIPQRRLSAFEIMHMINGLQTKIEKAKDPYRSCTYNFCPALSSRQQKTMESSLAIILPGIMYFCCESTKFGLLWACLITIGHTLETALTNFGPSSKKKCLIPLLSPMQHLLIDCMWLHSFISAMIIAPQYFGHDILHTFLLSVLLMQTLPIHLAVSFKTNFCNKNHINNNMSSLSKNENNSLFQDDKSMGGHIMSCFLWYMTATLSITIAKISSDKYYNGALLLSLGLFIFNIAPIVLIQSYEKKFNSLPKIFQQYNIQGRQNNLVAGRKHSNTTFKVINEYYF